LTLIAFVLALAAPPVQAQCTQAFTPIPTFILSNEGPGFLITKLINAGHGGDSPYQAMQFLASLPQTGTAIPPAFFTQMQGVPVTSQIFTTTLAQYSSTAGAIAISTDGTVQAVSVNSSPYAGQSGTTTISTGSAAVQNVRMVYSNNYFPFTQPGGNGPLTFWYSGIPCDGRVFTVFAIAWALTDPLPGTPAPPSLWLAVAGCLFLLACTLWSRCRAAAPRP